MSAFKPVIVTTTAPTREEAEKIGSLLLESNSPPACNTKPSPANTFGTAKSAATTKSASPSKPRATATAKSKKHHRQPQLRLPANPDAKRIARVCPVSALAEAEFRFINSHSRSSEKRPSIIMNLQGSPL